MTKACPGPSGCCLPRHPAEATSAATRRRQEAVFGWVFFMMRGPLRGSVSPPVGVAGVMKSFGHDDAAARCPTGRHSVRREVTLLGKLVTETASRTGCRRTLARLPLTSPGLMQVFHSSILTRHPFDRWRLSSKGWTSWHRMCTFKDSYKCFHTALPARRWPTVDRPAMRS